MAQGHPMTVRERWLRLTHEEPLEPELAICDAHHHLWDHGPDDRYLLDELLADIEGGHRVASTVHIDCFTAYRASGPDELKPVGETEFIEQLTAPLQQGPVRVAAGIVGTANLALGARVEPVLEAHKAASARFRGIRHWLNYEPQAEAAGVRSDAPEGQARDPKFREGFARLAKHGLSFDAWIYFPQIPDLVDLARAFPDTPIVLNHAGGLLGNGPYAHRGHWYEVWARHMTELAACQNVHVKLGGFCVPRAGFALHERERPANSIELAHAIAPYVLFCIEKFGAARCMFESNFPPDKSACSYNVVWNAFKRLTEGASIDERSALFHDTASRFYRLRA